MTKYQKALLLAVALCISAPAMARTAKMQPEQPQTFVYAGAQDPQKNRTFIIAAAQSLDWQVVKDEPGMLELLYDKQGKHQVRVKVSYTATNYQIEYLDSYNMNYKRTDDGQYIHPNYLRWVRNLQKRINALSIR